MARPSEDVTHLLRAWRDGDETAADDLLPLVYEELRRLAGSYLRSERPDHTLQATALVHEAYLRLVGSDVPWQDRVHFYAVAARVMRRLLVDHARARRRVKRGSGGARVTLDEAVMVTPEPSPEILDLDDALGRLGEMDPRKARAVELHFFGGLTYDEMAEALQISVATVHRELRMARAWLLGELRRSDTDRG